MRPRDDRRPGRRSRAVARDEGADTVERVGGDAAAVAQPGGELAVIDGASPESRLGQPAVAAIVRNLLQQFLGVHGCRPARAIASLPGSSGGVFCTSVMTQANQAWRQSSTTIHPTRLVGWIMGKRPH